MTNEAIANLRSEDHFIQRLDLGMERLGDQSMRCIAESSVLPDVGLLGTMVDVIGGSLIIGVRPQALLPTTSISLHGVDQLCEPGPIQIDASLVAISKRRAVIEAVVTVNGRRALGAAGFVVRDDPSLPPAAFGAARPPRMGLVIDESLWRRIGVRQEDDGAQVAIERRLYNNATALQGGATIALLEAAALTAVAPSEVLGDASITYLQQVRGNLASARVRERVGRQVIVDVFTDEITGACATAVFGVVPAPSTPT